LPRKRLLLARSSDPRLPLPQKRVLPVESRPLPRSSLRKRDPIEAEPRVPSG
jgi:hypothetical protein